MVIALDAAQTPRTNRNSRRSFVKLLDRGDKFRPFAYCFQIKWKMFPDYDINHMDMEREYQNILKQELSRRIGQNRSYSLRAFSRDLEINDQYVLSLAVGIAVWAAIAGGIKLALHRCVVCS